MSLRPIITTIRTSVRFRPLPLLRAYHPPEYHSNKGDKFYIPPQFPDNFELPSVIKEKDSKGHERWEEVDSTLSEASVKADRGDVQFEVKQKEMKSKKKQPDLEPEPNFNDM
ncbi:hypothetical protein IFM61606_06991 [Aspergillus udagawae]|uniref:54S ribosomal protein L36, mitochondrial n=1 Tax=Aspergillus udagawae TaxID=91492 RepID=A0ABQ1AAD6_9EURO|nr:hypothetical protein IFM51744_09692 [Aspergillus udagawae]GFF77345.1 hypothetical protein IFM53868_02066 [Aspergillus udagawae]GFG15690.1 hypothetical protein IFM5058_07580 [Aspergillus udagawae]GFG26982.1 hypothetical protein IFM61606_06991 [Aspergillus udagawae]